MISLFQMHSWSYNWRSVGERILLKQEAWSLHLLDGTTAFISERVLTIMWHSFYEGGEDGCSFIQFSQLHHPSLPFIACQCNAPMVSVYIRMLQAIVSSIPVPFAGSGLKEQCLWDQFPSGSRYYVQQHPQPQQRKVLKRGPTLLLQLQFSGRGFLQFLSASSSIINLSLLVNAMFQWISSESDVPVTGQTFRDKIRPLAVFSSGTNSSREGPHISFNYSSVQCY